MNLAQAKEQYANEDINLAEEFGSSAVTDTKHGVLWLSYENNTYTGYNGNGDELLNTKVREEATKFVAKSYTIVKAN